MNSYLRLVTNNVMAQDGSVYYKLEDLQTFFGENPVETEEEGGSDAYGRN
tara:strand:- start:1705 stop:1854 length:150 start_codon:yes stop_codon:yes gene_type:complete